MEIQLIRLSDCPERIGAAARWFHEKWGVPEEAYRESMEESCRQSPVPRWYLALDGGRIAGGLGIIENDFHPRRDLAPNVCAVYTEPEYRGRGIAGQLLQLACREAQSEGIGALYLLTDHTGFYERYGWKFFGTVVPDGETEPVRVYCYPAQDSAGK